MALINCPECKTKVSDKAESCPKCAYPIAGISNTNAHSGKIQTVEQTSKNIKLLLICALVTMIIGFVIMIQFFHTDLGGVGMLICFFGTIWFLAVKIAQWWRHG